MPSSHTIGTVTDSLSQFARAVPLHAIQAYGLISNKRPRQDPRAGIQILRDHQGLAWWTIETVGTFARRLLVVIAAHDGVITSEQLAFETRDADLAALETAIMRLSHAGLLVSSQNPDGFALPPHIAELMPTGTISMADSQMITTVELADICQRLGTATPSRKQERIDTIAAIFSDPERAAVVRDRLSPEATALLSRIASAVATGPTSAEAIGLDSYTLYRAVAPSYPGANYYSEADRDPDAAASRELIELGIVGMSDWESRVWIWREAWPLLDRPFFTEWPAVPAPEVASADPVPPRVPGVVALLDRAVQSWQTNPPAVLKNGEPRLSKTETKSLAKSLHTAVSDVDLVAQLAIGVGLLVATTVSSSGRGRNRRVEQAWMTDAETLEQWASLEPIGRWLRLLAQWCRPDSFIEDDAVSRHLLLWELTNLKPGQGWADETQVTAWFGDHYAPVASPELATTSLSDLRTLGVINPSGPIALTTLGATALADPKAAADLELGESTTAIVQADHTIIAPPDLRADITSRLGSIAKVESDAGAFIFRLDADLITRAVQAGEDADEIVDFLTQLSTVPITKPVTQYVYDAAARADRVQIISAPTVVVVSDPGDLKLACSVRAARLTAISDTAAVSEVPHAKVRTALERKDLSPSLLLGAKQQPTRRRGAGSRPGSGPSRGIGPGTGSGSGTDRGTGRDTPGTENSERSASKTSNRFAVTGPLALTPAMVSALDETS